jgi:hypothetical protein
VKRFYYKLGEVTIGVLDSCSRFLSIPQGEAGARSDTWLDLEQIATVEASSEDPHFAIEAVFQSDDSRGWRANQNGEQLLRIIFDEPTTLRRVQLHFEENEVERT